MIQVQNSLIH